VHRYAISNNFGSKSPVEVAVREAGGCFGRGVLGGVESLKDCRLLLPPITLFDLRRHPLDQLFGSLRIPFLHTGVHFADLSIILNKLEKVRLHIILIAVDILNIAFAAEGIGFAKIIAIVRIIFLDLYLVLEESVLRITRLPKYYNRSSLQISSYGPMLGELEPIPGHLDGNLIIAKSPQIDVVHAKQRRIKSPLHRLPDIIWRTAKQILVYLKRPRVLLLKPYAFGAATFSRTVIEAAQSLFEHYFCHLNRIHTIRAQMRMPHQIRLLTRRHCDSRGHGTEQILFVLSDIPLALLFRLQVLRLHVSVNGAGDFHCIHLVYLFLDVIFEVGFGRLRQLLPQFLQLNFILSFLKARVLRLALLIQHCPISLANFFGHIRNGFIFVGLTAI